MKICKKKFREIAFLAVLNLFPVQKLIFGHFWNCQKWNLVKKITCKIDLFVFTSFLAHSESASSSISDNEIQVEEPKNSRGKNFKKNEYSKNEVETLYKGVSKYGPDFATIFFVYKKKFHPCRTPVKLYDKWRHHLQYHSKEEYIKMKYQ